MWTQNASLDHESSLAKRLQTHRTNENNNPTVQHEAIRILALTGGILPERDLHRDRILFAAIHQRWEAEACI